MKRLQRVSILLTAVLLLVSLLAAPVWAWQIIHPSENDSNASVGVEAGKVIDDDLLLAGEMVRIDGTVNGDVVVLGNTVEITGTINGDLFIGCNNLIMAGTVNDDMRLASQNSRISGMVKRHFSAVGSQIMLDKESVIGGNTAIGAENFNVMGQIKGNVKAAAGAFNLTGKIEQNVKAYTNNINVMPGAAIGGSLYYRGSSKGNISPQAQIEGPVTYKYFEQKKDDPKAESKSFVAIIMWILVWLMAVLLAWLLWFYLSPVSFVRVEQVIKDKPWAALGWGFAILILLPIAALLTLFTVVGIPVALGAVALYTAVLIMGKVIVGYALVYYLAVKYEISVLQKPLAAAAVGTLTLMLLKLLPVLGGFISLLVALLALGSVFVAIKDNLAERKAGIEGS